jgi:hypothetical protein
LEKPHKQKRARFNHADRWKARRQSDVAARLADFLREHRESFPGFVYRINEFIAVVESDSNRSRARDRKKIFELLSAWEFGLTIKELMDDTGFSHWDIRQILADLIKSHRVGKKEELRAGLHSKQWVTVYKVK